MKIITTHRMLIQIHIKWLMSQKSKIREEKQKIVKNKSKT